MGAVVPMLASMACCGLMILIVGIILISVGAPNEIPMWYGVTLCKCGDMRGSCEVPKKDTITVPSSMDVWASHGLTQSEACPANPFLSGLAAKPQVFDLEQKLFSMDGLEYHPIVYRSDTYARVKMAVHEEKDDEKKVLLSTTPLMLSAEGGESVIVPQDEEADEGMQTENARSKSRSLMKGGRSAGGTARGRSGSAGRWGSGKSASKTSYGHSSCCVSRGTVIFVNRPGPRSRQGYYDSDYDTAEDGQRVDCANAENGCVFEVGANLMRDELDDYSLVPTRDMEWPLKMTVYEATELAPAKASYQPEFYISWWTEDPDNSKVSSYVLLPLGCLLITIPFCAIFFL